MADKAILDVQINTAEFERFTQLFNTYTDKLEASKKTWTEITEVMNKTAKASKSLSTGLSSMASHAGRMAGHIKDATLGLFKWRTILGAVSGLVGVGSLYGLDRLANDILQRRRQTLGLGADPTGGKLGVYGIVGRTMLGDPYGAAENVRMAQMDVTKRRGLYALGFGSKDVDTARPEDMMPDIISRIIDKTKNMPIGNVLPWAKAAGVTDLVSERDISMWRSMGEKQAKETLKWMKDTMEARKGELTLSEKAQVEWIKLSTSLSISGKAIETAFAAKLADLAPQIGELSENLIKVIRTFLKLPFIDKALEWFNEKLKELNRYLAGDDFQKQLDKWTGKLNDFLTKDFPSWIDKVGKVMSGIGTFADWLLRKFSGAGGWTDAQGVHHQQDDPASLLGINVGTHEEQGFFGPKAVSNAFPGMGAQEQYGAAAGAHASLRRGHGAIYNINKESVKTVMGALQDQYIKEVGNYGDPHAAAALMAAQAMAESTLDPSAVHDRGTGYGIYGARLDRRDRMFAWLQEHGYAKNSLEGQAKYMMHEALTDRRFLLTRGILLTTTMGNLREPSRMSGVTGNFEGPTVNNWRRRQDFLGQALQDEQGTRIRRKQTAPTHSSQWEGANRQFALVVRDTPGSNHILQTTALASGSA